MKHLATAALLIASSCALGQEVACSKDVYGAVHCQSSDGSSTTATTDATGTTRYQSNDGTSASSRVDQYGNTQYRIDSNPQRQAEMLRQLEQNRSPQPNGGGWQRGVDALSHSRQSADDAFYQAMIQGVAARQAVEAARQARESAERAEQLAARQKEIADAERSWRDVLKRDWMQTGLSEAEAAAIANQFRLNDTQIAITKRVEREGWQSGANGAAAAYKAYNYELANQLLVAMEVVLRRESEAQAKQ